MAAGESVMASVDQLIALFNRRSMDLPDGFLSRNAQFVVNGVPFEETLGRSPSDPLIRMLTRGAAGYRFAAKALQHAVPDVQLQRGELAETAGDGQRILKGQCWLSGRLRGTEDPVNIPIDVELHVEKAGVMRMAASLDPAMLGRLQAARLR